MRVTIALEQLTALWTGEGTLEPFLWPVFFKVDEVTLKSVLCDMRDRGELIPPLINGLTPPGWCAARGRIERDAWLHAPGGSHGNLPEFEEGETQDIPPGIGRWQTTLDFANLRQLRRVVDAYSDLFIGCVVLLLEEDIFPSDAEINKKYKNFYRTIRNRITRMVEQGIRDLGNIPAIPRGDPSGYAFEDEESHHVYYLRADNHLQELYLTEEHNWRTKDLTGSTRAQVAHTDAAHPFGYVFEDQESHHVFYRDAQDHIQHIYLREGHGWQNDDLTEEANVTANFSMDPAVLEGQIVRTAIFELFRPIVDTDDVIGALVQIWKVEVLRRRVDPSSLHYQEPFNRLWYESTGSQEGTWLILGNIYVDTS